MSLSRWTFAFRIIFVAFIVVASATTVVDAHDHGGHLGAGVEALGTAEIAAALLFLGRPTERVAFVALLAIFATALGLAILADEMPLRFVYYAATPAFILAVDRHIRCEAGIASKRPPNPPQLPPRQSRP
jgi:hypothetical protein